MEESSARGPAGAISGRVVHFVAKDVIFRSRLLRIFPEGISHDDAPPAQLKTGAARIAVGMLE